MKEKFLKIVKSKLLFAVVFNVAVMMLCIIFTSFSFENSNDYFNSIYICQKHFYYSSQINYILAIIIGTAQYVFSDFNCFVLAQVLLSCASFTAITFVFADKFNRKKAFVFAALINILFSLSHYQNINGNRTSAVLLLAGFMLVLNAIYNKRYYLSCWTGVLLIAFGTFYNFAYFFVALGFAVAFFFGDMISKKKFKLPFRKFFWYFRPFLLMFLVVTIVAFGLNMFSHSVNNATEEGSNYYEYSLLETSINGQPFPDYNDNAEEFEQAGITSSKDYYLLKNGYYDADGPLNINALKTISDIQHQNSTNKIFSALKDTIGDDLSHFAHFDCEAIIMTAFVVFGIVFVLFQKNRFGFFPVFYLTVGFIASVLLRYFYCGSENMIYGIRLFMIALLFYSLNFEKGRSKTMPQIINVKYGNLIVSCIVVACLTAGYYVDYGLHRTPLNDAYMPQSLIAEVERNPHKYYVFDTASYNDFVKYTENYMHPLWGFRDGYLQNVDTFGYFHNTQTLMKRNLPTNIYEAVLTHSDVYVVDRNFAFEKEYYFTENYAQDGQEAVYQQVSKDDGYKIYQVVIQ